MDCLTRVNCGMSPGMNTRFYFTSGKMNHFEECERIRLDFHFSNQQNSGVCRFIEYPSQSKAYLHKYVDLQYCKPVDRTK